MLLIIDESHPAFTRADARDAEFVRQLDEDAVVTVRGKGPDELYASVLAEASWENDIVFVGGPDGMAAALSGWINAGRNLAQVRWNYLGSGVEDGWRRESEAEGGLRSRYEALAADPGIATVQLVRIDVSTEPAPRYGLGAAFGGLVPFWKRLCRRSGGAMEWARIGLEWISVAREGFPAVSMSASEDGGTSSFMPNFSAAYVNQPFKLLPNGPERVDDEQASALTWLEGKLDAKRILEFVKRRDSAAIFNPMNCASINLRAPNTWVIDGWVQPESVAATVRVAPGPVVNLHRIGTLK